MRKEDAFVLTTKLTAIALAIGLLGGGTGIANAESTVVLKPSAENIFSDGSIIAGSNGTKLISGISHGNSGITFNNVNTNVAKTINYNNQNNLDAGYTLKKRRDFSGKAHLDKMLPGVPVSLYKDASGVWYGGIASQVVSNNGQIYRNKWKKLSGSGLADIDNTAKFFWASGKSCGFRALT